MAKKVQLKAKVRAESGRGAVKRLRAGGVVPAVIYGAHMKPLNVAVALKELEKVLHSGTSENVICKQGVRSSNLLTSTINNQ